MRALTLSALAAGLVLATSAVAAQSRYDWDALGDEFCRLTVAGDMAGLRPLLSAELRGNIDAASANVAHLLDIPAMISSVARQRSCWA